MSQLSFADVFNMARETAENSPVIQVRAQVAEVVPSVQRMMSEQHSRSRFIRVFKDTGRHLGRWEVFSDFLSLAASELDMARIRAPESIEHCRKICARYEASDIANMQEMFCMMVCALEAKFHDFLGAIFMELELGDSFRRRTLPLIRSSACGPDAEAGRQGHYPPGRDSHGQRSGLWCRRDADCICRMPARSGYQSFHAHGSAAASISIRWRQIWLSSSCLCWGLPPKWSRVTP